MALHEVQLKGYSVRPGNLSLGTFDSYGIEQLHVTLDDTWSGLAIDATFHNTPNDKGVTMLVDADGLVTVPPEACKQPSKYATITFRGVQDGVQRISCNLPYVVLDHAQVPGANSTATPSENAQALAQMQALRDGAVDAKNQAEAARDDAAKSAVASKESETNASQSATAAKTAQKAAASSASSASTSASTATTQAAAAKSSAMAAKASETTAGKSAQEAAASAANLDSAVNTATQKAAAASASAEAAKASESAAASSEAAARKYANSAELAAKTAGEASAEKLQQMQAIQDDVTAKQAQTATDATAAEKAKVAAEAAQNGAAASETAAADSAAAAKASEDAAAKSAADADSTANSINNSMMQISALRKRQNVLVGSETGNPIDVDDAFAAPLCGLTVYGKSTQDGTPTPDAPVPIVSAGDGGSVAVKVTGKNLFPVITNANISTLNKPTGGVRYGYVFHVPAESRVTISGNANIGTNCFVGDLDIKTQTYTQKAQLISEKGGTYAATLQSGWYAVYLANDYLPTILIKLNDAKVQIEIGTKATAYEPYREQLLTLPTPNGLPGIPVTSGGNYTDQNGQQWICDEVDLDSGVKVQRITTIVFSDKKKFGLRTTDISTKARFSAQIDGLKTTDLTTADSSAFCSALALGKKDSTWTTPNTFTIGSGSILFVRFENINSLDELQQYLQRTPMSLTAILATPIETPLTPAEITAYKALTAYAPDTVVQASDDAGIKLDYQRDVNLVVKKFEDAIASMTAT